jgi:hypothetical protein
VTGGYPRDFSPCSSVPATFHLTRSLLNSLIECHGVPTRKGIQPNISADMRVRSQKNCFVTKSI